MQTRSGGATVDVPDYFVYVGLGLAIISAILNGMAFVFNKFGIKQTEDAMIEQGITPAPGHHEYLKNKVWWGGMVCMIVGEILNFVAYSFAPSVLVAPMGSASVLVTALLSSVILKERLSFDAGVGVALCVLGSIVVVLQSPESQIPVQTIPQFWTFIGRPVTIAYIVVCFLVILVLIFWAGPRYGDKNPLVYISVAALGGSFLVQVAGAVGASIVYSISNWTTDNQFLQWSLYVLVVFIAFMAVFQVNFTNKALRFFSAGIVMPMFYVCFTTATLITFLFLFSGTQAMPAVQAVTLTVAFLVIVCGVALLYNFNLNLMAVILPFNLHKTILPGDIHTDDDDLKRVVEGVDADLYSQNLNPLDMTGAATMRLSDMQGYIPPISPPSPTAPALSASPVVSMGDDLPAPYPLPLSTGTYSRTPHSTNAQFMQTSQTMGSTPFPGSPVSRRMTRDDLGGPADTSNTAHVYKPEHLRRLSVAATAGDTGAKNALVKVASTGGTMEFDAVSSPIVQMHKPAKQITLMYLIARKPTLTPAHFHELLNSTRADLLRKMARFGVTSARHMETIWTPTYLNDSVRTARGMTPCANDGRALLGAGLGASEIQSNPIFDAIETISWTTVADLLAPRGEEYRQLGMQFIKAEMDFVDWSKSSIWFVEDTLLV